MKLVWTPEAQHRLEEIRAFVARDNPPAAERLIERLIERAELLARFPRLGRLVPEFREADMRELVEDGYRIVYRLRGDSVEILTVFEGHFQQALTKLKPPGG